MTLASSFPSGIGFIRPSLVELGQTLPGAPWCSIPGPGEMAMGKTWNPSSLRVVLLIPIKICLTAFSVSDIVLGTGGMRLLGRRGNKVIAS